MTKLIESHPELDELLKEFKTETVAEEALRILDPIPEEMWCIGQFLAEDGKSCALGHWVKAKTGSVHPCIGDQVNTKLRCLSSDFLPDYYDIAGVNNGYCDLYRQPTPKQRTIALLQDMIKAGY